MQTKEKTTKIKLLAYSAIFFALFVCFTLLVAFLGRKTITMSSFTVSATQLDIAVFSLITPSNTWLLLSEIIGYGAIASAFLISICVAVLFIKTKSLKQINRALLCAVVAYVITILFYVLFEFVSINYRPILIDGELEKSYPSSHFLLSLVVCFTIDLVLKQKITNKKARVILSILLTLLATLVGVGRVLSAMHWVSDVIGSLLLGLSICFFTKALQVNKN